MKALNLSALIRTLTQPVLGRQDLFEIRHVRFYSSFLTCTRLSSEVDIEFLVSKHFSEAD